MTLSTVFGYLVALQACCIVANGQGRGRSPGNQKLTCSDFYDMMLVLGAELKFVSSTLDTQDQNLEEIKVQVKNSIPSELARQTQAIEKLKADLPSGAINSHLQKQAAALEVMKVAVMSIVSQLERQTSLQQLQSVAIENITSQLRKQDGDLKEVRAAVSNVSIEERKFFEDFASHDYRLQEHDQLEKSNNELINEIHGALFEPRDCSDVATTGQNTSGVYLVLPGDPNRRREVNVYCDLSSPGGGWLVFQRRKDGSVNFERTWDEYKSGFGEPSGEFWLGNHILHVLTSNRGYKLRIEMEDFNGEKRFAEYTTFFVASVSDYYRLTVGGYSGDAGDSFSIHSGNRFSTKDSDNDKSSEQCSVKYHGAWWYGDCHTSNLNGAYLAGPHTSYADGIEWKSWHGFYYSLKATEMKIAALD